MHIWSIDHTDLSTQYAQYKGAVAPTPIAAPSPVVIANPNPGGIGAAVPIGEPVKVPEAQEKDTTTLAFGQAEPGRDVFGDHPHNDIKSVSSDAARAEADAEVISSASTQSTTEAATQAESSSVESSTVEISSSSEASSEVSSSAAATSATTEASTEQPHSAEGPKDEEQAEAARVREALYPDAKN